MRALYHPNIVRYFGAFDYTHLDEDGAREAAALERLTNAAVAAEKEVAAALEVATDKQ